MIIFLFSNLKFCIHLIFSHFSLILNLLNFLPTDASSCKALDFNNTELNFEVCILLLLLILCSNFLDLLA